MRIGTFVHLFEWSHGDVAIECEAFLGPKKFSAVQVSPPNEHIVGDEWWTRYQPVSYALESRSGSHEAFVDMVKRCKAVGVDVIVDVVVNHMAAGSEGVGVNGTHYTNRNFDPLYSPDDFHHSESDNQSNCQVNDYNDLENVQKCDLVGLPDLDTSSPKVQKTIASYLDNLLEAGVAGFRLDASKHQESEALGQYLSQMSSTTVPYVFCEVIEGDEEAVKAEMYFDYCDVTEFNFAQEVGSNIVSPGKMKFLSGVGSSWGLIPSDSAVTFTDNHDTQRGNAPLTYKDGPLYDVFNIFLLTSDYGYPKLMSSYEFDDPDQGPPDSSPCDGHGWVCEHRRYGGLVAWRISAGENEVSNFQSLDDGEGDVICFSRGNAAFVAINRSEDTFVLKCGTETNLRAGTYYNVLDDNESTIDIDESGKVSNDIEIGAMGAVALHLGAMHEY